MTTDIESCLVVVSSRPKIKSMLISFQGFEGIGKGVYNPVLGLQVWLFDKSIVTE